jgi:putative two-component system response regulator
MKYSNAYTRLETVLVVDDDAEWRNHLCRIVGREYPVIFAREGDEALRIASHTDTKVILLDVMMPEGQGGFETFCAFKKCTETKNIPIIMLSAVNHVSGLEFSSGNMERCLGDAPFAFLEKPSTPAILMKTIALAIDSVYLIKQHV